MLEPTTYAIAMRTRFRGIDVRQGMVWRGRAGWAEWSPFLDYAGAELVPWWRAAVEAAETGWPTPLRDRVPVNSTIPALPPQAAHDLAYTTVLGDPCGPIPAQRPTLTEAQVQALAAPVRRMVVVGGLRLAKLLDDALGPQAKAPGQKPKK